MVIYIPCSADLIGKMKVERYKSLNLTYCVGQDKPDRTTLQTYRKGELKNREMILESVRDQDFFCMADSDIGEYLSPEQIQSFMDRALIELRRNKLTGAIFHKKFDNDHLDIKIGVYRKVFSSGEYRMAVNYYLGSNNLPICLCIPTVELIRRKGYSCYSIN